MLVVSTVPLALIYIYGASVRFSSLEYLVGFENLKYLLCFPCRKEAETILLGSISRFAVLGWTEGASDNLGHRGNGLFSLSIEALDFVNETKGLLTRKVNVDVGWKPATNVATKDERTNSCPSAVSVTPSTSGNRFVQYSSPQGVQAANFRIRPPASKVLDTCSGTCIYRRE